MPPRVLDRPRWALVIVALPGIAVAMLVYRLREPKRGTADLMAAMGEGEIEDSDGDNPRLFEHGLRQFLVDMVDGLRADMRTVLRIRTMRYALVGVASLLFTVTAISSWLAQYYIRHLHVAEGDGEAWFMALAILAGGGRKNRMLRSAIEKACPPATLTLEAQKLVDALQAQER